jgi:hypothetical protein
MELDGIALVLRVEKTFTIDLPVEEYLQLRIATVGELYRLVLQKLGLNYQSAREIDNLPRPYPSVIPESADSSGFWNAPAVWRVLKSTVEFNINQNQINESMPIPGLTLD